MRFINLFVQKYPEFSQKIAYKLLYKDQFNVNLDLCNPCQKRVLISYITLTGFDFARVHHASYFHLNQILHYFVSKGYCVDLCRLDDMGAYERLKHNNYDIAFGFGPVYKEFCKKHNIPIRICFVMENNPVVVMQKYGERLKYFNQRHPQIDPGMSLARMGYFDEETFALSNNLLLMNSVYNSISFKKYFQKINLINSNAIFNSEYQFIPDKIAKTIDRSRKNVLWFGSKGIIHKGLDILIDAVAKIPDMKLHCYGVDKGEQNFFKHLKVKNTIDCGSVNVLSDDFIDRVVYNQNICVFPSCSEGMSTAVATCMAHGIIPIITRETGFNDTPNIILLEDFSVECVIEAIQRIQSLSSEQILEMRKNCYYYARQEFCIDNFNRQFYEIMDSIITK